MPWLTLIISNVVLASLLAFAAWFVQRRLQRPAVARILWLLVLVKLVTPPLVSVPIVELSSSMACTLGMCNCATHALMSPVLRDALPWVLLAAWSAGAGATAWTAWRRWCRFQRLTAPARPAPTEWQSLAARLAGELSIRRPPEILAVPGRLPPLVVAGWRRPRLLLPAALLGQLTHSQCEALLLHELVHIKRGDHLMRLLELAVGVVFWWLPLVGVIGRQLRTCEETCCDTAVVARLPRARRDYARLLLDVIDFAHPLPRQAAPQATAMSAANDLEQRLRGILDTTRGGRRTWPAAALVVGLACATLPCGLNCEFVGGRATAAVTPVDGWGEGCEPAAGEISVPSRAFEARLGAFCCPS
jgi:beta-lactamase regulating signal transducer with metallopeptidase domain